MIAGIFHEGSGLGNQLHRYVTIRCLSLDKGYEFSMLKSYLFKGKDFLDLDTGGYCDSMKFIESANIFKEKKIENQDGWDVRGYDHEILEVQDNTIIDGEFQDPRYFEHHLSEIREWLRVEPLTMPDDLCVINFRGGEYAGVKDLFLPKEYWNLAIQKMKKINPNMRFEVHTDDPLTAEYFFPHMHVFHDMELNWRSVRYANYLILSNSSFAILPSLLNEDVKEIIAPKYWAGYNKGYWQLPQNEYKKFKYIHHMDC